MYKEFLPSTQKSSQNMSHPSSLYNQDKHTGHRETNPRQKPGQHPNQNMSIQGNSMSRHDERTTPRGGTHERDPYEHANLNMSNRAGSVSRPDEGAVYGGDTYQRDPYQHDIAAKESELQQLKEKLQRREAELSQLKADRALYKNKYEDLLSNAMGKDRKGMENPSEVAMDRPEQLVMAWEKFKKETHLNAFKELFNSKAVKQIDRKQTGKILLDYCEKIYLHCLSDETQFQETIKESLALFRRGRETEEKLMQSLIRVMKGDQGHLLTLTDREVKKTIDSVMEIFRRSTTFLGDLETQVLEEIQQRRRQAAPPEKSDVPRSVIQSAYPKDFKTHANICRHYFSECYYLFRMMQPHMPAMHLDFRVEEGSWVNGDTHDVVNDDLGRGRVCQLFIPALYRSRDGDLLVKGLVMAV